MRRLFALLSVIVAVSVLFLARGHGSRSLNVLMVHADDGNPACQLPPDPQDVDTQGKQIKWFPAPPEPHETQVPPTRKGGTDCPFYKPAWQRFMLATQPMHGVPAFLGYPSFDDLYPEGPAKSNSVAIAHPFKLSLHPRNLQLPNSPTNSQQEIIDSNQIGLIDIDQAGPRNTRGGNLIDQHGHLVFYAIHVNLAFRDFLIKHNLLSVDGLNKLDPNLPFDPGVMELKSAWMIVDSPQAAPNYFVVQAEVPFYEVINGRLQQGKTLLGRPKTRPVWVALLALHVVFTLPGHPEMIWSTFEHTHIDAKTGEAVRDNAPAAPAYPLANHDAAIDTSTWPWPLYQAKTTYAMGNHAASLEDMVKHWDTKTQSFTKGGLLQTSVFRPYPASKSKGHGDVGPDEDDEVVLINKHATKMFNDALKDGSMEKSDMRQNYRLVGAVWLDQPLSGPAPSFVLNRGFFTAEDTSTDDDTSIVAGEGRLGSTAMESFTESEEGAPSCFSCHDTKPIHPDGGKTLLPATKLNVSHVMSKFLARQAPAGTGSSPPAPSPQPKP